MFLFAVLFGLSMDYQVLLLSRIKERAAAGSTTREAASAGITATAWIITGAALITIAGFVLGQLVQFQELLLTVPWSSAWAAGGPRRAALYDGVALTPRILGGFDVSSG